MREIINVYCDESCHLENDHQKAMVLGAVWCPLEKVRDINTRIREIKVNHDLPSCFEIKWTKVSPAKYAFYLDLIDYFFDNLDLHFRALVIPDKSKLRHGDFNQTHDDWYYKMYFDMIKVILDPKAGYLIYLDIKDTRSSDKIRKLHEILCKSNYDFSQQIIQRVQTIRSNEVALMQLADLLIGAVSYANRNLSTSFAKQALITRIRERSDYKLTQTTLYKEDKFNLFIWNPKEDR